MFACVCICLWCVVCMPVCVCRNVCPYSREAREGFECVALTLHVIHLRQGFSCLPNLELGWWSVSPGVPCVSAYSQCYSYSHVIIYIQVFTWVLVIWTWIFVCTARAFYLWVILICLFETVSCYAEQGDFKLSVILLLQPSKCWIIVMHHFA